jgi:hypothetical protein
MLTRWNAWRRRQPTRILYVAIPTFGATIVSAGLRRSCHIGGVRMVELHS